IGVEGATAMGFVEVSVEIVKARKCADCIVVPAAVVKGKRVGSDGRVVNAAGVEQQRSRACGHIIGRIVESERSRADAGVEEGVAVGKEREPAKSRIEPAGSQAGKGPRPLISVATAKVSFLCLRSGQKPKAGK